MAILPVFILARERIRTGLIPKNNDGGGKMGKRKKDPSTIGLNSAAVEGQGTTTSENGSRMESSARKKQKKS